MSIADIRGFGRLEKDFGTSMAIKIMDKNGELIAACPVMVDALQDAIRLIRHLGGNPCCQIKALEALVGRVNVSDHRVAKGKL